jgi:hypothetical protein
MSNIITDHLDFGEVLLLEANRELISSQREDAAYSARLAIDYFKAVGDVPECQERAARGIQEAMRITLAAHQALGCREATWLTEAVDRRFAALTREAEELMRDSRGAVCAALRECSAERHLLGPEITHE